MIPSLSEYLDQQEGVTQERFAIESETEANWALRKIKQIEDQRKNNLELANAEIEKINSWKDQVNKQADNEVNHFQSLLDEYARKCRLADPKFKSLKLPNGKIGFRKQQPKWNYDDQKLLEHLKANGHDELIRIKEEPDKTAIKKVFKLNQNSVIDPSTGEIVEGISVELREDAFKWEV